MARRAKFHFCRSEPRKHKGRKLCEQALSFLGSEPHSELLELCMQRRDVGRDAWPSA
jgi:hypothetical protein